MKHLTNARETVTITADATLREAADKMKEVHVGSLIVVDGEGRVSGIVTDRDLCCRAVSPDRDPDSSLVEKAMTPAPITLSRDASVSDVLQVIRKNGVRRVPIVDDFGAPVALVSIDDVMCWLAAAFAGLARVGRPAGFHGPLRDPAEVLADLEAYAASSPPVGAAKTLDEGSSFSRESLLDAVAELRQSFLHTF